MLSVIRVSDGAVCRELTPAQKYRKTHSTDVYNSGNDPVDADPVVLGRGDTALRVLQVEGMVEETASEMHRDLRDEESTQAEGDSALTTQARIVNSTHADDECERRERHKDRCHDWLKQVILAADLGGECGIKT